MIRQANTILVVMVSFLLAHWLRFNYTPLEPYYLQALLLCLVLVAVVIPATGAFREEFQWALGRKMRRLLAGWAVVLMILISIAAMLKTTDLYSRIWFGLWVMTSNIGLILLVLISHVAAIGHRNKTRKTHLVVLVGAGQTAARVEERILSDPASDMELVACFGTQWSDRPVQPLSELAAYIEQHGIREVWVAAPWEDKHLLENSLETLKELVVDVNVVPDLYQYRLLNQGISEWGGLPVISLSGTPMTGSEMRLKTLLDRVGAFMLLLLLSPALILVALAIRLTSPGPVLFHQQRHGIGGEPIEILKFRTMKVHKEASGSVTQAQPGDERVTAIGKFLRTTSLDEIPQLINVLRGQMSLVGPRPHAVEHNELYKSRIPKYMLRHKVRPGLTGWAQVNGYRGLTDTQQKMAIRIEHDLWYIQNWSLWLDLKILLMTPFVMIHRNAY